jgi:hypothetical protein
MWHPSGASGTYGCDPASPELVACLLVELAHRIGHGERRELDAQFGEVAIQFRLKLGGGGGGLRELDIMGQCGHLIYLRRRKRGLGVAKALGDCIRVGAHHSHDWGTEHLGPFRRRPERPRCAPDDEGNNNSNNSNDAAHTHDGIDKVPFRIDLRPRWPFLDPITAVRWIPLFNFRELSVSVQ